MGNVSEHIALFIDIENFFGYCNGLGLPIDLAPELKKLTEIGKVTVRRAFGDIQKLPISIGQKGDIRRMLQQNLIIIEDIPYLTAFKNSADIRLVIDALSVAYTNKDIDIIAVVGSDRDYLPLFSKLREIGKEIIGVGGSKDMTPEISVRACDYFFYHENLVTPVPQVEVTPAPGPQAEEPARLAEEASLTGAVSQSSEAVQLLLDALRVLEAKDNCEPPGATVIHTMRRLKADFDVSAYGYKSFKEICESAAEAGLIAIFAHGTQFNIKLLSQPASPPQDGPPVDPKPATAAPEEHVQLKRWLEDKMKIKLPSQTDRLQIYRQLKEILVDLQSVSLIELSNQVAGALKNKDIDRSVYKILYSLYRANCFTCSQGESTFNPVINAFQAPVKDPKELDRFLIGNSMRSYKREVKKPIVPSDWSEVFFKSDSHSEYVKEIFDSL